MLLLLLLLEKPELGAEIKGTGLVEVGGKRVVLMLVVGATQISGQVANAGIYFVLIVAYILVVGPVRW